MTVSDDDIKRLALMLRPTFWFHRDEPYLPVPGDEFFNFQNMRTSMGLVPGVSPDNDGREFYVMDDDRLYPNETVVFYYADEKDEYLYICYVLVYAKNRDPYALFGHVHDFDTSRVILRVDKSYVALSKMPYVPSISLRIFLEHHDGGSFLNTPMLSRNSFNRVELFVARGTHGVYATEGVQRRLVFAGDHTQRGHKLQDYEIKRIDDEQWAFVWTPEQLAQMTPDMRRYAVMRSPKWRELDLVFRVEPPEDAEDSGHYTTLESAVIVLGGAGFLSLAVAMVIVGSL